MPASHAPRSRLGARHLAVTLALVLAVCVAAPRAGAQPRPAVRLLYTRDARTADCPSPAGLRAALAARLGRDAISASAPTAIEVGVSRDARGVRGRIQTRDAAGRLVGSHTLGPTAGPCSDLVDALTLALAIAIDPVALLRAPAVTAVLPPPASAPAPTSRATATPRHTALQATGAPLRPPRRARTSTVTLPAISLRNEPPGTEVPTLHVVASATVSTSDAPASRSVTAATATTSSTAAPPESFELPPIALGRAATAPRVERAAPRPRVTSAPLARPPVALALRIARAPAASAAGVTPARVARTTARTPATRRAPARRSEPARLVVMGERVRVQLGLGGAMTADVTGAVRAGPGASVMLRWRALSFGVEARAEQRIGAGTASAPATSWQAALLACVHHAFGPVGVAGCALAVAGGAPHVDDDGAGQRDPGPLHAFGAAGARVAYTLPLGPRFAVQVHGDVLGATRTALPSGPTTPAPVLVGAGLTLVHDFP